MPVIVCPYCEKGSDFQIVSNVENRDDASEQLAIGFCRLCGKPAYFRLQRDNQAIVRWSYPSLVGKSPDGLAEPVDKAFAEALRCRASAAPNGALLMCRRAIQEALDDLGAPQGDLPTQLQWLVDNHKLTPDLKDWADHARIGGKLAGHGTGGKEWGDPSKVWGDEADADAVIEFCRSFFDYVYVLPKRNAERRASLPPPATP